MEHKVTNKYLVLALFWSLIIAIACLISVSNVPDVVDIEVENADKLVHFTFYAIFSVLWFAYLKERIQNHKKLYLGVFFFAVLFGIAIEICQSVFTETRQADVADAIANTLGSFFGLAMLRLYYSLFNKK